MSPSGFPAVLSLSLVVVAELSDDTDFNRNVPIEFEVRADDGPDVLARIEGGFNSAPRDDLPADSLWGALAPFVANLRGVQLTRPGRFHVVGEIDGKHPFEVKFQIVQAPESAL